GLVGMEVVEVAPEYDVAEITSLLGTRVIYTVLGTLIEEDKLGTRPDSTIKAEPEVAAAAADEGIVGG
nr:arginase family protein [Chloroflexia bacterium]